VRFDFHTYLLLLVNLKLVATRIAALPLTREEKANPIIRKIFICLRGKSVEEESKFHHWSEKKKMGKPGDEPGFLRLTPVAPTSYTAGSNRVDHDPMGYSPPSSGSVARPAFTFVLISIVAFSFL
jgi:hypothetical protein